MMMMLCMHKHIHMHGLAAATTLLARHRPFWPIPVALAFLLVLLLAVPQHILFDAKWNLLGQIAAALKVDWSALVWLGLVLPARGIKAEREATRAAAAIRTCRACNVMYTVITGKLPPAPGFYLDAKGQVATAPELEPTAWFGEEQAPDLFSNPEAALGHLSPAVRAYFFGKKGK